MECSICYEQFIRPTSDENRKALEEEFDKNHNDYDKWFRYCALLLLLPIDMPRYKCRNDKCCKYMCDYCYEKTIDKKKIFKCHYCRVNDYKTYMTTNVLQELQFKVLGKDGVLELLLEQIPDI